MQDKKYLATIVPLGPQARKQIQKGENLDVIRAAVWSETAKKLTPLLGSVCSRFLPATYAWSICNYRPFGVMLGGVTADMEDRLGLRSSDKDKVCALPGTGGFCRKSDLPALKGMFARHHRELQEAIGADPTGRGFIYEMFRTELSNHEYAYTQDVSETLDCLGITQQMLEAVPQLQTGLALACRSLLKHA